MIIQAGQTLIIDKDTIINEPFENFGTVIFPPNVNAQLIFKKQAINRGLIIANPVHTVKQGIFLDSVIDENNFVGGGHDPIDSDPGLWNMKGSILDINGAPKNAWTNATGSIPAGTRTVSVVDASGWVVGDELEISPTANNDYVFERPKIAAISGNTITLDRDITLSKPQQPGFPPAEISNLTRNFTISSPVNRNSHVLLSIDKASKISNVEFFNLGPRKDINADGREEFIRGRYGLHFHRSGDGSRGTVIDSCVMHDVHSHAYVFHSSHGITFNRCVSVDCTEVPAWADPGHPMHDTVLFQCLFQNTKYVSGSKNMDQEFETDANKSPNISSSAVKLGKGFGNSCIECVVAGTYGDSHNGGGYDWEANNDGTWKFLRCLAHNCQSAGLFVWQVTPNHHIIEEYSCYNTLEAIFHGAYGNNYRYTKGKIYNGIAVLKANSMSARRIKLEDYEIAANGTDDYALRLISPQVSSGNHLLIRNVKLSGWKKAPIYLLSNTFNETTPLLKFPDIVNCDIPFTGQIVEFDPTTHNGEAVRVQPKVGECYELKKINGQVVKTIIPRFAPDLWGDGDGLTGTYFKDQTFTQKAGQRIDTVVDFGEWWTREEPAGREMQVYPQALGNNPAFSVIWSGYIMPQFSEEHTISFSASGSYKLLVSNQDITATGKINLTAGVKVPVRIELINTADVGQSMYAVLWWQSASLEKYQPGGEPIPMSQLYSDGAVIPPPPPPVNNPPQALAGSDKIITLPATSVALQGSGNDVDNDTLSFKWDQVTGPQPSTIIPGTNGAATVSNLIEGVYNFLLTVTDSKGATGTDEILVTVQQAPNKVPTANAGSDITITLPATSIRLTGNGVDTDGVIVKYQWLKVSGPTATIVTPGAKDTDIKNLVQGSYIFRLTVTDDKGATASDTVNVTVKPAGLPQWTQVTSSGNIVLQIGSDGIVRKKP
jgi:hypothetical protein